MIIAIYEHEPFAQMITAEKLRTDIKSSYSRAANITDITLPDPDAQTMQRTAIDDFYGQLHACPPTQVMVKEKNIAHTGTDSSATSETQPSQTYAMPIRLPENPGNSSDTKVHQVTPIIFDEDEIRPYCHHQPAF